MCGFTLVLYFSIVVVFDLLHLNVMINAFNVVVVDATLVAVVGVVAGVAVVAVVAVASAAGNNTCAFYK